MPKKGAHTKLFPHIQALYCIELGKPTKMAHKLTEKVLHPKVIEKSNVKLAISIKYIRDWFNQVNVKSTDYGIRARDERRKPIRRESWQEVISYLLSFCQWLENWQTNFDPARGLSVQMFNAAIRTTKGFIALINYLFSNKSFLAFVLLGNIQSDYLEQRFG